MTIKKGERLPSGQLAEMTDAGAKTYTIEELTKGKRVIIFGLPGAFTPTCSAKHVPGYVDKHDELQTAGIDDTMCISVNDVHVMGAWAKDQKAEGRVRMLADGNGTYTKALGLEQDRTASGMGLRSLRYSMLVEDGVVKELNVEAPGEFKVSSADTMLARLKGQ
jgi:peroxiredoxin